MELALDYKSILIVDDDPTQIAILTAYFANNQVLHIQSAPNPTAALPILNGENGRIDLLISDLQMPEMDGLEFLRHLNINKYDGELILISSVEKVLLSHAAHLAVLHNLQLIGDIQKPLTREALDEVFCSETHNQQNSHETNSLVLTQSDFSKAIECNEIVPYFQPKIDVRSGRIVGAESLARWHKPNVGSIPPETFIDFAEENGHIKDLTLHLLESTLREVSKFLKFDPKQCFAINIAPKMMDQITLPDQLYNLISSHGISQENISFEITENSILNLDPVTLEVLSRLRIFDFEVAIDDFGTGAANIQALRDFPYSELKIDKSFITNAMTSAFSTETIHAAVALAREQNMRIVAEGVENVETLEFVREHGIEHAQGFLFSRALSAQDYTTFISQNNGSVTLADFYRAA